MRYSFLLRLAWCWAALLLPLGGCIDPYMPDVISTSRNYLVVDGFINSQGVSTIQLTRTYDIAAKTAPPRETRATVFIEEEGGPRYPLAEAPAGTYTSASLALNPTKSYRLHLTTQAGTIYASDFVPVKTTPAIDSVTWRGNDQGLRVAVNTHDNTNSARYYRWEYDETWEIVPVFYPTIEYANGRIQPISVRYPTLCWNSAHSTAISVGKTTSLSQDVVSDQPVRTLPTTSPLLFSKYSILVQQHALTKPEYEYWELLKKNTENIGTLFDPLPAQVTGNVHCLNGTPDNLALGYVSAHSVQEKRIFINKLQLPFTWRIQTGYESCMPPDTVRLDMVDALFSVPGYLPVNAVFSPRGGLIGYTGSTPDCIDCRRRGTAVRPSFWQ